MYLAEGCERRCKRCRRRSSSASDRCVECREVVDCTTLARAVLRRFPPVRD